MLNADVLTCVDGQYDQNAQAYCGLVHSELVRQEYEYESR